MGKNKKKGAKRQPQVVPESAKIEDQTADDQQLKNDSKSEIAGSQKLESASKEETAVENTRDEPAGGSVTDREEIEKLRAEIEALKSELADERNSTNAAKESDATEPPLATDSQEYKDLKAERDEFEAQYNNLLNRISSMKTVFSKMKESQEELETVKEQLSEYESQNVRLKEKVDTLSKERKDMEQVITTLNQEYSSLDEEREAARKECDTYMVEVDSLREKHHKELQLIVDEKAQLEEQLQDMATVLKSSKQDLSMLKAEKEDLSSTVEDLEQERNTLQENIRSLESDLENGLETFKQQSKQNELEINSLRSQLDKSQESNAQLSQTIEQLNKDIQSMSEDVSAKTKLEQECKERVLQIGKLRHEAIILNEHLTKALTMLKQSSDSESVDKELISNLLISFVSIPRADPKKFEVLELISSFLSWDDDKKRQAGLLHYKEQAPKSAGSMSSTGNFVTLWTEFLEKESEK